MKTVAQLRHDPTSGRLEFNGDGLHCGECLEVLVIQDGEPVWIQTRLEYGSDWFLIGLQGIQPNGLFARM